MNTPLNNKSKILIVDDMTANIKVLHNILQNDYMTFFSTSGEHALKIAKLKCPELILLDIIMPDMDGYEVCQALKSDPITENIPIVFITAKDTAEDETKGFELGAVDYITKPFNPIVVSARVKNHISLALTQQNLSQRNAELIDVQYQLEQQNAELIEADHLRKDVERISRHDMKSPLTGIMGISELVLSEKNLSNTFKKDITLIRDAAYRLLQMMTLSLDLFKMKQGTYQLEAEKVELIELLKSICFSLRSYLETKEIIMILNDQSLTENDEFFIQGEPLLCYSIFSNLIKNAAEASPDESPITLHLYSRKMAHIQIHNQGGVPIEIKDRFFEEYVTFGKKEGTGLGTYSAKLMVLIQNGTIDLDSSEESGTTITVKLPILPSQDKIE